MPGSDRDRRVSDAAILQKQIEAVLKVDGSERQRLIHDRLVESIQDACDSAKEKTGRSPFNEHQLTVIKDIAYRIVHITDPGNKIQRGFFGRLYAELKDQSAIDRVKSIGLILGMVAACLTAFYTWAANVTTYVARHWRADSSTDAGTTSLKNVATPSLSTTSIPSFGMPSSPGNPER